MPYSDAYHDNGYQFAGWNNSTAEGLKVVNYMVNGAQVNTGILSSITDFTANLSETRDVNQTNILGSLNIGTSSGNADYLLHVKGKIRSQEIKVETTNWPDYVFANNYKLAPLTDVANYLKKNQHLPDLPSAEVVEKDGINLGEMNKVLLKKVEELTLYLIKKNKQLSNQQKQINYLLRISRQNDKSHL